MLKIYAYTGFDNSALRMLPVDGICRNVTGGSVVDGCGAGAAATCSNALKADPSDGRPRGKLRDFANTLEESTKREVAADGC